MDWSSRPKNRIRSRDLCSVMSGGGGLVARRVGECGREVRYERWYNNRVPTLTYATAVNVHANLFFSCCLVAYLQSQE